MKDCREIEPLLTSYVDEEGDTQQHAEVRAHLVRCAPCRLLAQAERDARDWLRSSAAELRGAAPVGLTARCQALCAATKSRPRWMLPTAVAASIAVLLGGVGVLFVTNERRAIAAELSADHERCFSHEALVSESRTVQVGALAVAVPEGDAALGLVLTGLRQCRIRRTLMAHALYRSQGRPVSLYVAPRDEAPPIPEIMGAEVRTWMSDQGCYTLVGRVPSDEMDRLASFLQTAHSDAVHSGAVDERR